MAQTPSYDPPLALTIISTISIGIAALFSLWILIDIVLRRGWKPMMAIMIPVYIINALYLWPITMWTYIKYSRPPKPKRGESAPSHVAHHPPHANAGGQTEESHDTDGRRMGRTHGNPAGGDAGKRESDPHNSHGRGDDSSGGGDEGGHGGHNMGGHGGHNMGGHGGHNMGGHGGHNMGGHEGHNMGGGDRPMFATTTIGVCHCGAGCVLGDIIGEWIVYGTGATIRGRALWPEFLVDFAFALGIGIFFQYFSIAPMAGEYGMKSLYRAAKADVLSLTFFEIGLFGWMAIFQIAIFNWELEMNTVTYWWMMQIGMFLGHWTSFPINWWLIKTKIKEPCA